MSKNKKHDRRNERGNVLIYILVAVALLGALSFAVAQSGRGNIEQLSTERARLHATEILEYSNIIANAVTQTKLRGFDDTEISFENASVSGYTNANCTEDLCKIFNINGGGVNYTPPSDALGTGQEWRFSGSRYNHLVGTTGFDPTSRAELYMGIVDIPQEVCIQINELAGVDNPGGLPPEIETYGFSSKYTGGFGGGNPFSNSGNSGHDTIIGQKTFCALELYPNPDVYSFVKILVAR